MIDFLFTNKRLKKILNYEKKISNFFLYTNYKAKIIQSKNNEFFLDHYSSIEAFQNQVLAPNYQGN